MKNRNFDEEEVPYKEDIMRKPLGSEKVQQTMDNCRLGGFPFIATFLKGILIGLEEREWGKSFQSMRGDFF